MKRKYLLIFLILILGFVLRVWNTNYAPPGLNRDEAAIGYNAYSILRTGKDEYGKFLPLSFKSFGDWKLPFYIYLDVIPVKLFSLTPFSVRLPSIFLGTATILTVYFLVKELLRNKRKSDIIALLSAFFISISPWHIHFSRVAAEANVAVFFVVLGLYFFIKGIKTPIYLLYSSTSFGLSMYTYHGNHVFTPLLLLALFVYILKSHRGLKTVFMFILPVFLLGSVVFANTLLGADRTKISGLTPLSDVSLVYQKVALPRFDHTNPYSKLTLAYHNKITFLIGRFLQGYYMGFSPEFLFIKGGNNLQHNIPDFGNLYMWDAPFFLLGLFYILRDRLRWRYILLFWLLISPVAAAITKDAPHSARMIAFLPLPYILSAVGFLVLSKSIRKRVLQDIFLFGSGVLLIINFTFYLDRYFIHFPKLLEAQWGGGYKQLVEDVDSLSPRYKNIVIDNPDNSPYIYFLFYKRTDPKLYQKNVVRYPTDIEGFQNVKSFGGITYKKIDWADDLVIPNRLLISWVDSTPAGATGSAVLVTNKLLSHVEEKFGGRNFNLAVGDKVTSKILKTIRLKNGISQFYILDIERTPAALINK
ncbi:glycosyltransferase family 39 protein [Patescibacteria group bacterium]|nr:glycosyltransferase family 39 protein [Patescibacteria group bacterium]MCL5798011.1 glycosyltransferase family 39 protein [Patescibacteria group bacterium]